MVDFFTNIVDVFELIFSLIDQTINHITTFIVFVLELVSFQTFLLPLLPGVLAVSMTIFFAVGCIKLIIGR